MDRHSQNLDQDTEILSVVCPAFNEEHILPGFLDELTRALEAYAKTYEVIVVDDGSEDATWDVLRAYASREKRVKGLRLSRNFGHQLAVFAGLRCARGQYVAVMDSDGQDPPELLGSMFDRLKEGFDVVNCIRRKRKESIWKRAAYATFYRLYRWLVPFSVPLDSGDFSAMRREVVEVIKHTDQRQPFGAFGVG